VACDEECVIHAANYQEINSPAGFCRDGVPLPMQALAGHNPSSGNTASVERASIECSEASLTHILSQLYIAIKTAQPRTSHPASHNHADAPPGTANRFHPHTYSVLDFSNRPSPNSFQNTQSCYSVRPAIAASPPVKVALTQNVRQANVL
jgi:hypothetical protein